MLVWRILYKFNAENCTADEKNYAGNFSSVCEWGKLWKLGMATSRTENCVKLFPVEEDCEVSFLLVETSSEKVILQSLSFFLHKKEVYSHKD